MTPDAIAATRGSFTIDDLHASAERNRQWGRWGPNDEIGTLNNVTPEMVRAAAGLVRKGRTFGLAMNFDMHGPQRSGADSKRFNPVHTMFRSGLDVCSDYAEKRGIYGADDMITMPLQCGTQWDALSHIFYYDRMWNGYDARRVTGNGAQLCGIEKTRDRMVGRGVLLDIARDLGLPWLPDGFAITVADLERCAARADIEVRAGDFLLVRTGMMERCRAECSWGAFAGGDAPGLAFETVDWLRERDVAAVATDTWGVEVRPNEMTGIRQPFHWIAIPIVGLTLGEMFQLGDLAKDCADDGVCEFFFCGASLPFTGAVGCPLNPMAIK